MASCSRRCRDAQTPQRVAEVVNRFAAAPAARERARILTAEKFKEVDMRSASFFCVGCVGTM